MTALKSKFANVHKLSQQNTSTDLNNENEESFAGQSFDDDSWSDAPTVVQLDYSVGIVCSLKNNMYIDQLLISQWPHINIPTIIANIRLQKGQPSEELIKSPVLN